MQTVIITGARLTKDPETRVTQSGKKVVNFSIAHNENKELVNFFDCVGFEGKADLISQYFAKGNRINIRGRLRNEVWDKDGVKQYRTKIVIDEIDFVDKKGENQSQTKEDADELPTIDTDDLNNIPF